VTEPLELVRSALADRYAVEREIGRGGMAVVYLARDLKHRRNVAIKVLSPELASAIATERFLREIETAARLQHPHIVPVYDSGEAGGLLLFVMPYIEGESLRERITRQGPVGLDEAALILRDLASALDFAHAHGVVHRDVKPANIMLSDGRAMIADFGIARAVNASVDERLTTSGIIVGTPLYMSPEQASFGGGDHGSSDQYSLACVMFEMLVGVPPFSGGGPALLARHSVDPMPSIRTVRETVPPGVEAAIARAMAKVPADRFPTVTDFSRAVDAALSQGVVDTAQRRLASRRNKVGMGMVGVALVAAAGGFAVMQLGPKQRDERGDVAEAGTVADRPPRLAVIQFDNLGQAADSMFTKGITVELTSRLAELTGLDVISRMSAMQYDRSSKSIAAIARELGVDYVLTGSISTDRRPDGSGRTRVMPELLRVHDGRVLWRGRQDAMIAPGDLLVAQSSVVDSVANALNLAFLPERRAGRVPPTSDREAYEQFLAGGVYASRPRAEEPTRLAILAFERATARDPNFAVAYAKLAEMLSMYHALHYFHPDVSAPDVRAKTALERAWQLDSAHSAVRLARGFYEYLVLGNNRSAMAYLGSVAAADTNDAELLSVLGEVLRSESKWSEALAVTRRAADLDPRSQRYAFDVGVSAAWIGRYDEADQYLGKASSIAPDWPPPYITRAYVQICWKGDTARALRIMRDAATKIDTTRMFIELVSNYREDIAVLDEPWQRALTRMSLRSVQIDSGKFYLAEAELHSRLGDPSKARAYFDSARVVYEPRAESRTTTDPGDAIVHAELGLAYAGLARADDAIAEGTLALRMVPAARSSTAHAYLALSLVRIYIVLGRYDSAIDVLESEPTTRSLAPRASLMTYPNFAPLRTRPRFQKLVRQLE
jgi:serine/threonine-protein kinase